MSFGYSVGGFLALTQLAWKVVQSSRKACGAHDELTREVTSPHLVLHRLQLEVSKPESLINRNDDNRREELAVLSGGCNRVLRVLSQILEKYNALSDEERSFTKLWQKIRFGNGEMQDLMEIRQKISTYTSAITLFLNLLLIGSQGRVERYMDSQGGELKGMRDHLNWITASLQAKTREGSVLTSYAEDDKAFWKDFRRELIKEGFSSAVLSRYKAMIKEYVMGLGSRGALDDLQHNDEEAFIQAESSMPPSLSPSAPDQPTAVKKRTPMVATIEELENENRKATKTPEGQKYHASHAKIRELKAEKKLMMAEKKRLKETVRVGQSQKEEQECSEPTYSREEKLKDQQPEAMKNEHNTREEDIAPEAEVVVLHNDTARDRPQIPEPKSLVNVVGKEEMVVADKIEAFSFWGATKKTKLKEKKILKDDIKAFSFWGATKIPKVKEQKVVVDEVDDWSNWGSTKKSKDKEEKAVQDETDPWSVWGSTKNPKGKEEKAVQDESETFSFWCATKKSAGKPPPRQ
jgi:hypothetical protein